MLDPKDHSRKPWTRQLFVEKCSRFDSGYLIDVETLSNIENGRLVVLSPERLLLLANALELTPGERREFFLAATGIDEKAMYLQRVETQTTLAVLLEIMQKFQGPAFIADQYWDILAVNQAIIDVYDMQVESFAGPIQAQPITRFNMMRVLFSPEFEDQKDLLGADRYRFAIGTLNLFRSTTLRYRTEKYYQALYPALCEFKDFRDLIQRESRPEEDFLIDNMPITLDHPRHGLMQTISTSVLVATPFGELQLSTFSPLSQKTARTFARICRDGNPVYPLIPEWPDHRKAFLKT